MQCPKPTDALAEVFGESPPAPIPKGKYHAANWWIDHQEPARKFAEDAEPLRKDGEITGWKTPYHDRLVYTAKRYLKLNHNERLYVQHNVEHGIPWRGDDFEFYKLVVAEHAKMLADPDYIPRAKEVHKQVTKGAA